MKNKFNLVIIAFILSFFVPLGLEANNIQITSTPFLIKHADDATVPVGYAYIKFDLSWDNSFRTLLPNNWDAAWVFCKYNVGDAWYHVYLEDSNSNNLKSIISDAKGAIKGEANLSPIGYILDQGYSYAPFLGINTPVGCFIYRKNNGYGRVEYNGVKLAWNYAKQGVTEDDPISIKVFALEMVYIPKGPFYLGSGGVEYNHFCKFNNPSAPFLVTSDSIRFVNPGIACSASDSISAMSLGPPYTGTYKFDQNIVTIGPLYPVGYRAFYLMKYELTQKAYVDFLNCLPLSAQIQRQNNPLNPATQGVYSVPNGQFAVSEAVRVIARNGIFILDMQGGAARFACNLNFDGITDDRVNLQDDGLDLPNTPMTENDAVAYFAWAGLRPMSELEFEKACRGPKIPVANELAWGNSLVIPAADPAIPANLYMSGTEYEKSLSPGANLSGGLGGNTAPIRVGSFADSATNRTQAGAGYYGNMDLSGNVWEICIGVTFSKSRAFGDVCGYGQLDANGNFPNNLNWTIPLTRYNEYAIRGASSHELAPLLSAGNYFAVSSRTNLSSGTASNTRNNYTTGARGARTANQ